jgi:Phosphoesterase family
MKRNIHYEQRDGESEHAVAESFHPALAQDPASAWGVCVSLHGLSPSRQLGRRRGRTLQRVSWIDPAFTNFNPLGLSVNDDHPMADIKDGQDLVLAVYDALASSPQWDRSLLVVVYDENGGFYDHVPPPQAADDDPEMFGRYGVPVPAIIVSPWIEPCTVSHTLFDHTSSDAEPGQAWATTPADH